MSSQIYCLHSISFRIRRCSAARPQFHSPQVLKPFFCNCERLNLVSPTTVAFSLFPRKPWGSLNLTGHSSVGKPAAAHMLKDSLPSTNDCPLRCTTVGVELAVHVQQCCLCSRRAIMRSDRSGQQRPLLTLHRRNVPQEHLKCTGAPQCARCKRVV